jgi:hypothetical protein
MAARMKYGGQTKCAARIQMATRIKAEAMKEKRKWLVKRTSHKYMNKNK